jgi:hypothetical protein
MMLLRAGLLSLPLPTVECAWIDAESDPEDIPKAISMRDYGEGE